MREKLTQYVNLLFAGAQDADEIRAEILQNTLDRYDDLIAQGKSPEAAYRLAIGGIGDVNEILGTQSYTTPTAQTVKEVIHNEVEDIQRKKLRAVAIAMYILCAIPIFILGDLGLGTLGLCLTIALVAAATYIMMITNKPGTDADDEDVKDNSAASPQSELKKSISNLIWAIGLAAYFLISFTTHAWYITWLIFPILGCTEGLAKAIIDLKEAVKHEN